MRKFRTKEKWKRALYSPITIVILLIIFALVLRAVIVIGKKARTTNRVENEYQSELNQLHQDEQNLQESIDHLQSDRGVEEELRENFSVAGEGEEVIVLIDNEEDSEIDEEKQRFLKRLFR